MRKCVASILRRLASRIDPPAPLPVIEPNLMDSGETQLEIAKREIGKMQLRDAMRRYSPTETPGQC